MGSTRVRQVEEYKPKPSRLPETISHRELAAYSGGPVVDGLAEHAQQGIEAIASGNIGGAIMAAAPGDSREEKREQPEGVFLSRRDADARKARG